MERMYRDTSGNAMMVRTSEERFEISLTGTWSVSREDEMTMMDISDAVLDWLGCTYGCPIGERSSS